MRKRGWSIDAAVADELCRKVASGSPLLRVCAEPGMPSPTTVYVWRQLDAMFREKLERAKTERASRIAAGVMAEPSAEGRVPW